LFWFFWILFLRILAGRRGTAFLARQQRDGVGWAGGACLLIYLHHHSRAACLPWRGAAPSPLPTSRCHFRQAACRWPAAAAAALLLHRGDGDFRGRLATLRRRSTPLAAKLLQACLPFYLLLVASAS